MADSSVPTWWVVVFLALALGAGVAAVAVVGGSVFPGVVLAP